MRNIKDIEEAYSKVMGSLNPPTVETHEDLRRYYIPLAMHLIELKAQRGLKTFVVGIDGMPGIGKSALVSELDKILTTLSGGKNMVYISIDDFYYTKEELKEKMIVKWGTGAHDLVLATDTITALKRATASSRTAIPRFDKTARKRTSKPDHVEGEIEFVLLEGFGVGYDAGGYVTLSNALDYLITLRTDDDVWKLWRTEAARRDGNEWFIKNIDTQFDAMKI